MSPSDPLAPLIDRAWWGLSITVNRDSLFRTQRDTGKKKNGEDGAFDNPRGDCMIIIRRVADPHGCWGNMAPYPVVYRGKEYRTTEALFQSLRIEDEGIIDAIRAEKSPMGAKFMAKKHKAQRVVEPMSAQDLDNMRLCLRLKVEQHPELARALLNTGEELIVEDCRKRKRGSGLFWGAFEDGDEWQGQNWLGMLLMELRGQLRST